jgi:hypothetical protein
MSVEQSSAGAAMLAFKGHAISAFTPLGEIGDMHLIVGLGSQKPNSK